MSLGTWQCVGRSVSHLMDDLEGGMVFMENASIRFGAHGEQV